VAARGKGLKSARRTAILVESEEGTNTVRALLNYASFEERRRDQILQCLKKHGQRLDLEIAKETGVPLNGTPAATGLAAAGAVIM
jgi:hypothetical protein